MIRFLYGQDIYRSRAELRKIIEDYKKSNPDWMDFIRIDCRDNNMEVLNEMRRTIDTVSMFNQNKLIVIENIFNFKEQEELLDFFKKRDLENVEIVVWDEKPNKGSKLFKFLQNFKIKEFKPLQGAQLRSWIRERIKADDSAIDKLIEYIGSDLWRMSNEINKLISYKIQDTRYKIQTEDVELLVRPEIDLNIFKLVDALGYKDKNKALNLFKQHLEKGEDENYLFSMFIYQIRNLLKIKTGGGKELHPFVFGKTQQQARNFSLDELKKIYYQLLAIDLDIKRGKTNVTTGLELLIVAL